ncbi:MAG: DUF362 domain-containing protein [Promethearchaeota archaeon]|jgi:uncharacterized Fe-S center protein
MSSKVKVYWASPIEVPGMPDNAKNMVTNNLVKTRLILDKILDNIHSGDKVGVKIHVGEAHNTRYLRPDYVREVVKAIKSKEGIPTLIETQGMGNNIQHIGIYEDYKISLMHRRNAEDHLKIAHLHGYIESITGAPLRFIDGDEGIDRKIIKIHGVHFEEVSVAAGLFDFDKLVVISHFKGHPLAGFGGAFKQLGIGCVSKHGKHLSHVDGMPTVNSKKCDLSLCAQECIKACPVDAITIKDEKAIIDDSVCYGCLRCTFKCPVKRAIKTPSINLGSKFVERFIDNAAGVITFGPDKIRYINFAFDIPLMCDCASNPSMPVVPDLGIFGSSDPLAIDKACVDAETKAPGLPVLKPDGTWSIPISPGIEKFKAMNPMVDTTIQLNAAKRSKLGSFEYDLVQI